MSSFNLLQSLAVANANRVKEMGHELHVDLFEEAGRLTIGVTFLVEGNANGWVTLSNVHENSAHCWAVTSSHLVESFRGQGLGQALYSVAFFYAACKAKAQGEKAAFLPNCSLYLPEHIIEDTSPEACRLWVSIGRQLCQPVVDIKQYLLVVGA